MRRVYLTACVLALAAGCHRHPTITPMPGVLPSAGMLVRTNRVRLSRHLELRQYELLSSDISNDMYPFNIARAKPAGKLVSRLYARRGLGWRREDYARLPSIDNARMIYVSPKGRRVLYEHPDVGENEGELPLAYGPGRRVHSVAIYDHRLDRKYVLDCFMKIVSLGGASHWRRDGEAVAFTTTACREGSEPVSELVVLDATGQVILSSEQMPEVIGLEFISFSPDGSRIAALRPLEAGCGGRSGGFIVVIDPAKRTVEPVAGVPALLVGKYLGRFEDLVKWDEMARPSVPAAGGE